MGNRRLKRNEQLVLHSLIRDPDITPKNIAKNIGINESTVRRITNHLKMKSILKTQHIPNYGLLGYSVMMIQNICINSGGITSTKDIINKFKGTWNNCIDIKETFDNKIIVRSVWKDTTEFKRAHAEFYSTNGTDWLEKESLDMIPVDPTHKLIELESLWHPD